AGVGRGSACPEGTDRVRDALDDQDVHGSRGRQDRSGRGSRAAMTGHGAGMNHLLNLYNQLGAGPMNLSLGLIEGLRDRASTERVFYAVVPDDRRYAELEPSPGVN